MTDTLDIDAIEKRLDASAETSPHPWSVVRRGEMIADARGGPVLPLDGVASVDEALIAHAPADLCLLIARVREVERERDARPDGITPEDAAHMDCGCMHPDCIAAVQRVEAALRAHAATATKGGEDV